ncbi:MAG: alpha-galactosidase, partial [Ignavibacteriaceae bacterium]|nr:alpha-galactosidase [Ignavibacteriaceae bacterium]
IDLWTKEKGFLFADLSIIPPIISLPVKVNKDGLVNISRVYEEEINIEAGTSKKLNPSAFIFHNPDFYNGLVYYSDLISERGLKIPKSPNSALEPEWCAWGYERDFNTSQIISTLPLVKKMGLKWVTLDDGWQNANGDWGFSKSKFPNGKTEFIEFVNKIKSEGFKFRLWWTPFDAHDSSYNEIHYKDRMNEFGMKFQSELAKDHPDWFMLDVNGNRYQVSWWNSYLLCPELTEVQEYYKSCIEKAIKEGGIEGLKIDGQHFNLVPPCYNKKHHHKSPYDASKAVPQFFKIIYDAAKSIDTNFVFNLCPCGTNFSVYNLPYASQTVSSDPSSSWQVRHRGKIFNALSKGSMSYSGDHVELTNRKYDESTNKWVTYKKEDFVSTLAVGGVPSTKFTLEGIEQAEPGYSLTVDKLPLWKKWIDFYNNEKLGRCRYLNLYDIAYSIPETHVLKNDSSGVYYYFFFSSGEFSGEVELKGLDDKEYLIYDVKNERYTDDYNGEKIKITFIDDAVYKLIPKGN